MHVDDCLQPQLRLGLQPGYYTRHGMYNYNNIFSNLVSTYKSNHFYLKLMTSLVSARLSPASPQSMIYGLGESYHVYAYGGNQFIPVNTVLHV